MSAGNEKPPMDLFDRIEEEAAKDEAARIVAMSDEELDAELAAGGLDPAAVRAKGRALGAKLEAAARHARRVRTAKLAAVVAVAVALVVAAWMLTRGPADGTRPAPGGLSGNEGPNVAAGRPTPEQLRDKAAAACDAKLWKRCLELLDDAREDDPAGDATPAVQAQRARAARGLRGE